MKTFLLSPLLLCLVAITPLSAQQAIRPERGKEIQRVLASGERHDYELDLGADQFIFGDVYQQSLDVVISVHAPDGTLVGEYDGPARGSEIFRFQTKAAGIYRITVAPFKEDSGKYTFTLRRAEPVATTPEGSVDQLMALYGQNDAPGGIVAVVRQGKISFVKTYGAADLANTIPITRETAFCIGSISKQFTGFAIATLAAQGKLSLEDDVRKYLPELPDLGKPVTLRNLLNHTGGYPEIFGIVGLAGYYDGNYMDQKSAQQIVKRQKALQFEPGSRHLYNNTGYMLLADVVERVTDTSYSDWMQANLFAPLGMDHTVMMTEAGQVVPKAATSYSLGEKGKPVQNYVNSSALGSTGIYTTVDDLAKWLANLHNGTVGGPDLLERLSERGVLTNGDTIDYGLGISVGTRRGVPYVSHSGGSEGFISMLVYFPKIDAGVVTLSNYRHFNTNIAMQIADEFFAKDMTPVEKEPEQEIRPQVDTTRTVTVASTLLDEYAGRYEVLNVNLVNEFVHRGSDLISMIQGQEPSTLLPLSDSVFTYPDAEATVTFHRGPDGRIARATHDQGREFELQRVVPFKPSEEDLKQYTGRYLSTEFDILYTVTIEKGALVARHFGSNDVTLKPKSPDVFTGSEWFFKEGKFARDDKGKVNGLRASSDRTLNVLFEKLP